MSTLKKPQSAKVPTRSRAEWDDLIRRREALDAQRKAANREAERLAGLIAPLDEELTAWLEKETADGREQSLSLKAFVLSFVWHKPAAMAVATAVSSRSSSQPVISQPPAT